jgi:hypothetical protein
VATASQPQRPVVRSHIEVARRSADVRRAVLLSAETSRARRRAARSSRIDGPIDSVRIERSPPPASRSTTAT